MKKKNIILISITAIILLISSVLLIRKYYDDFQKREKEKIKQNVIEDEESINYSYETVDDILDNLINSSEWTKMSSSEKKNVADTLLKKLEREGKIENLFYDSSNMLFSFQYKDGPLDGALGGLSINLPWERQSGDMPIN